MVQCFFSQQISFSRLTDPETISRTTLVALLHRNSLSIYSQLMLKYVQFKPQLWLPFFTEILFTMCWSIKTVRNDLIYRDIQPSMQRADQFSKGNLLKLFVERKQRINL
jgi:hypothetical protein